MRETIDLQKLLGDNFKDFHPSSGLEGFKYIIRDIVSTDSEKGSSDEEIILQRRSDEKYFKVGLTVWPASSAEINPIMEEVFPRQITTTVYE